MTPTRRVSDSREAFEKWAEGEGYYFEKREIAQVYVSPRTHHAWVGWQAALSTMGDVVAAGELQAVVDEMDKVDQMLVPDETYASNAVEDIVYHYQLKLSAILNRDGK